MKMSFVETTFCVQTPVEHSECYMYITGDVEELGNWLPNKALAMSRVYGVGQTNDTVQLWSLKVKLRAEDKRISYRYFIAYTSDGGQCIHSWETFKAPRTTLTTAAATRTFVETYGKLEDAMCVAPGWLTTNAEVRIGLCRQVALVKDKENFYVQLKVTRHQEASSTGNAKISIANLLSNPCEFLPQATHGIQCSMLNAAVFRAINVDLAKTQLSFALYKRNDENEQVYELQSETPLNCFPECCCCGSISLFLEECAQLEFEYMVVAPLPNYLCDMRSTYQVHWKRRPPIDIGHKGMGSSKNPILKENTIESLQSAALHGAEYVEFDVQLTKDKVPVIYHEFVLGINSNRLPASIESSAKLIGCHSSKSGSKTFEVFHVPLKDVQYDQLKKLTPQQSQERDVVVACDRDGYEVEEFSMHSPSPVQCSSPEVRDPKRSFPRLSKAFHAIHDDTGFFIEVKYPQQIYDDRYEQDQEHFFERNDYVDAILECVLRNAGTRRVILSSFDPNICIMMQRKQNKYPVIFLTMCSHMGWGPYKDIRCQSLEMATNFALSERMLGLAIPINEVRANPTLISSLQSNSGLVIFVWGNLDGDVQNIKQELPMDGIIIDHVADVKKGEKSQFYKEREMKSHDSSTM